MAALGFKGLKDVFAGLQCSPEFFTALGGSRGHSNPVLLLLALQQQHMIAPPLWSPFTTG